MIIMMAHHMIITTVNRVIITMVHRMTMHHLGIHQLVIQLSSKAYRPVQII